MGHGGGTHLMHGRNAPPDVYVGPLPVHEDTNRNVVSRSEKIVLKKGTNAFWTDGAIRYEDVIWCDKCGYPAGYWFQGQKVMKSCQLYWDSVDIDFDPSLEYGEHREKSSLGKFDLWRQTDCGRKFRGTI